ncbi:hypothetical protein LINGRAHAP2_LOCUS4803 [Linum grandiflorum]
MECREMHQSMMYATGGMHRRRDDPVHPVHLPPYGPTHVAWLGPYLGRMMCDVLVSNSRYRPNLLDGL